MKAISLPNFTKFRDKINKRISCGYTLVELIVVISLSALLIGVLSDSMLRQLLDSKKIKDSLSRREVSNRLAYLLQVEAGEAKGVDYGGLSLPAECGASSSIYFRLDIPRPTGDILTSTSYVYYYQDGATIKRCGPAFNQNGSLRHPPENEAVDYVDSEVATNSSLDIVGSSGDIPASCGGVFSTNREISYVMIFLDAGSGFQPLCNVVKARTFYVADPPPSPL